MASYFNLEFFCEASGVVRVSGLFRLRAELVFPFVNHFEDFFSLGIKLILVLVFVHTVVHMKLGKIIKHLFVFLNHPFVIFFELGHAKILPHNTPEINS